MESSDNHDMAPDATDTSTPSSDATSEQPASAAEWASAGESSALSAPSQGDAASGSDAWYPVVGATDPVISAIQPVPGSEASAPPEQPVSTPEATASGVEGPFWPEAPATVASAGTSAETPTAETSIPESAWPEPPTPWADTGAMAAVSGATASDATVAPPAPDVSELPTAVNTPQVEQASDQAAPAPEPPPAYSPPPPPGYAAPSQPLYPQAGAYIAPPLARPLDNTPVIVEAILAFFGFYGIGWMIAGETTIGVILLIAGFVWDAIFVVAAFTVIGLCCVVPLQLIFVALSAFQLNTRLQMRR
jgi:hypothetical protein